MPQKPNKDNISKPNPQEPKGKGILSGIAKNFSKDSNSEQSDQDNSDNIFDKIKKM